MELENILKELPTEKIYIAVQFIKFLAKTDDIQTVAWKILEATCEEEELTPEEELMIAEGRAEIEAGLGIDAEEVWKELGI